MQPEAATLQKLLLAARAALKAGEPSRAADLAEAVLKRHGSNALALFLAGSAHAARGSHAAAAAAFLRAAAATAGATPGSQRHQLHLTCADNLLLEAERALPPAWMSALHDDPRLAALQAGIAAAVAGDGGAAPAPSAACRVLVLGGLGLEAVLAAHAGAAAVSFVAHGNPLAAQLCGELAADSGVAAVAAATSLGQLPGQPPFDLLVLADALGSQSVDWALLRRQLAAAAPLLAGGAAVLPHALRVRGQLVECAAAVELNEVDVEQLRHDTGGLDLSAANSLLPRAARSFALPAHPHSALSAPATLLELPLVRLLLAAAVPGSCHGSNGGSGAALLAAATQLEVTTAGVADALCWWVEQLLLPGEASPVLSAGPSGLSPQHAQQHTHIWQHLQYLQHVQLAPGQRVAVSCSLAGTGGADAASEAMQALSLAAGSEGSTPAAADAGSGSLSVRFEVCSASGDSLLLPASAEQAAVAAAVPNYHMSMLNDSARTAAYRDGISAALQQAAARREEEGEQDGEAPLVLEIGSGSGLLCLLACQAGAQAVVGC